MERSVGAASAVMQAPYLTVLAKMELRKTFDLRSNILTDMRITDTSSQNEFPSEVVWAQP